MADYRALQLTPNEYRTIFDLVREGKELSFAKKKLKYRDRTTVARAYNVATLLYCRGIMPLSDEEATKIVEDAKYHTNAHYVHHAFLLYKTWHQDQQAHRLLRNEHTHLIKEEAKRLRACIRNPRLHMLPDKRELLEVDNQDWRLDPVMWFYLCTPDFSDRRKWSELFPLLTKHMRGSTFWKDSGGLRTAVRKLEEDYQIAAIQLGKDFDQFRELWNQMSVEKLIRKKDKFFRPSRYPDAPPEEFEGFEPIYDRNYCEEVLGKFSKVIEGLPMRLLGLEQKLEQLYNDLEPLKIYPIIDQSYCCECPQRDNQRGRIE